MGTMLCTYHAGAISNDGVRRLETALRRAYRDAFGQSVRVLWCELPAGQAFTAGRASDITYLMVEAEEGLDAARRERALHAFAAEVVSAVQIPIERVMITLADRSAFARFLGASRDRVRPRSRLWFWTTTALGLWRSRRRNGYLAIRANL